MTRRTGKVGGNNETPDSVASEQIHSLLDDKSKQAGLVAADRFQAQTLVHMMSAIGSGYAGPQTLKVLEAMGANEFNPLREWGAELPISQEMCLLNSSEFNG